MLACSMGYNERIWIVLASYMTPLAHPSRAYGTVAVSLAKLILILTDKIYTIARSVLRPLQVPRHMLNTATEGRERSKQI